MSKLFSSTRLVSSTASQALTSKTLAHPEPEIVINELNGSVEPINCLLTELIAPSQLRPVKSYCGEGKDVEVETPYSVFIFNVAYYMLFEGAIPITRLFYGVKATIATRWQGLTSWHIGDVIHG